MVKKSINGDVVLLVKRVMDRGGQLQQTVLEIMHEPLRQLLVEMHHNVEGIQLTTNTPTVYLLRFQPLLSYAHYPCSRSSRGYSSTPEFSFGRGWLQRKRRILLRRI